MIVEDIWFDMKDGRKALIRSPREEDIRECWIILSFLRERQIIY